MKKIFATELNKEKLIFIGASALLAFSVYHVISSAPVALSPSAPVSSIAAPGPLDREKIDARVPDVAYYVEGGVNELANVSVVRDRKNPFEPIKGERDREVDQPVPPVTPNPNAAFGLPPIQNGDETSPKLRPTKVPDPKVAQVGFSGVMTMNNITYGLLKSKDGRTIQVREGDYIDGYKYTVAKIEKQAILFSDEENTMWIARDQAFD